MSRYGSRDAKLRKKSDFSSLILLALGVRKILLPKCVELGTIFAVMFLGYEQ